MKLGELKTFYPNLDKMLEWMNCDDDLVIDEEFDIKGEDLIEVKSFGQLLSKMSDDVIITLVQGEADELYKNMDDAEFIEDMINEFFDGRFSDYRKIRIEEVKEDDFYKGIYE